MASAIGTVVGQHAARLGRGQVRSGITTTKASSSLNGSGAYSGRPSTVPAATSPPKTLAAAFSGWPS